MAEQALGDRNRRDYNLVGLCLYFFSDLDGKFHCVNMLTAKMSVCMVRTSASPFVASFDYIISFADCLRLDMIVMVIDSENLVVRSKEFSFFFTSIVSHITILPYNRPILKHYWITLLT